MIEKSVEKRPSLNVVKTSISKGKIISMKVIIALILIISSVYASEIQKAREAYAKGDFEKAFGIAKLLAAQGNIDAKYELGGMYYKGQGTSKNMKKAIFWWEQSGEQGHVKAQENLVYMYRSGKEIQQNDKKYLYWLKKSANKGSPEMQFMLAYMYSSGEEINKDKNKAFYWAEKASQQNHPNAQFMLGYMYCRGYGTSQNLEKCASLTRKFHNAGDHTALSLWNEFSLDKL